MSFIESRLLRSQSDFPRISPFSNDSLTTVLAMTELYVGASDLERQAIVEIVSLAMDAPAKAKSGHSGTAICLLYTSPSPRDS